MSQLVLVEKQWHVRIDPHGVELLRGPMPHQLTGRAFPIEMDRGITLPPFFLESNL
jgi:hypothetical protein